MRPEGTSAQPALRLTWERLAVLGWAGVLTGIVVRLLFSGNVHSVYPVYGRAGQDWLAGLGLYNDPDALFRYSPLVAVLLVPLSLLPDLAGNLLWRAVNVGVYLAGLAWLSRAALPTALTSRQKAGLFLLALPLSVGSLNNGQSNALVVGLILIAFAGAAADRWNLAAGCLALACLFKVYPLAAALLLLLLYPKKLTGRLALGLAAGLALPFLFGRPDYVVEQYRAWGRHLLNNDRHVLAVENWYRDFRLLPALARLDMGYGTYEAVQALAGVGTAVFCLAARRASWPRRRLLTLALCLSCCWMTVFGAATESCTYIFLAPAASWALLEAWLAGRPAWLRGLLAAGYALQLVPLAAGWFAWNKYAPVMAAQPAGGLLILGGLLWAHWPGAARSDAAGRTDLLPA